MENKEELMNIVNQVNNSINKNKQQTQIDYLGYGVIIAMTLKVFGLVPIIIKVAQNKSAEDISLATPIMFLIAFFILALISFIKRFYFPLLLFITGMGVATILLIQKILYEKSKKNNPPNLPILPDNDPNGFQFPSPYLQE